MTRDELCELLGCAPPPADFRVTSVTHDSRRVAPGTLFIAIEGERADGHDYVGQARERGAVAIAGARADLSEFQGLPYVHVERPQAAEGLAAHALAGDPSREMTVVGVTGTNGKTSTVYLAASILNAAGHHPATLGTLGCVIGGERRPGLLTTPFGEELAGLFAAARDGGHGHVVMEVSSHALEQGRVAGIHFDCAAFTNLTQDHLDFHVDMEAYRRAKLRLFEGLEGESAFGVVNLDDPSARAFQDACPGRVVTYGAAGDCRAKRLRTGIDRTTFVLSTPWGQSEADLRLLGAHNVSNALCAAAVCGGLGVSVDDVARGLEALESVPGRFEAVRAGQDFAVTVDYAHTEDGLRNVLRAVRGMCKGRLITVFGCGGDRDKGKRPKMGEAAAGLSDFAILTSDNPRTEDPHRILLDIEVGVQRTGRKKGEDYLVIEDRAEAIREAIHRAKTGDFVMIAGKGHEDYQILGENRVHFDDREEALKALESR